MAYFGGTYFGDGGVPFFGDGDLLDGVVPNVPDVVVSTIAELQTALNEAVADGGGSIGINTMIDTSLMRRVEQDMVGVTPAAPIEIIGSGSAGFTHGLELRHTKNVRLSGLTFTHPTGDDSGAGLLELQGDVEYLTVSDCNFYGLRTDRLGDYKLQGSYPMEMHGVRCIGSSRGTPGTLAFERCNFRDLLSVGVILLGFAGGLIVRRCTYQRVYADCWNISPQTVAAAEGPFVHEDSEGLLFTGDARDEVNPHVDPSFQFISTTLPTGTPVLGVRSERVVAVEAPLLARGSTMHGALTSFPDSGNRVTLVDPIVRDCVIATSGNHHTSIQCNGGVFERNTFIAPGEANAGSFCRFDLNVVGDNPITLTDNITGQPAFFDGPNAGTAPITDTGGIVLGLRGELISYATAFAADRFDNLGSLAQIIAAVTPAVGGPAEGKGADLTAIVNNAPSASAVPTLQAAPVVTGSLTVGGTLTSSQGTWSGVEANDYGYAWVRNGRVIEDANDASYTIRNIDIGADIQCVVSAGGAGGVASDITDAQRVPGGPEAGDVFVLGADTYFVTDPPPTGSTAWRFDALIRSSTALENVVLAAQHSAGQIRTDGNASVFTRAVEDSTGTNLGNTTDLGELPADAWIDLSVLIDVANEVVVVNLYGTEVGRQSITSGTGLLQTDRQIVFGAATTGGLNAVLDGLECALFRATAITMTGQGQKIAEISIAEQGSIAAINADPWTNGSISAP
ncbi:hypothetical protein JANAI62_03570 [Jannaschia pagri]|uniref:Uncharacterized protein n=1 Tax=Jannaschia pagri TaxID=2829797 RepID=A0ABQ4NHR7_9RHOB|nr:MULTISPECIES: hypothetical protein [unclassified Jannaschia]GIT90160.1 hypothetical protein JANAI61_06180 [Jannaschia sp. AI_61]GIT93734.1 hypothetical protein JANAI62_03570 [Jannaschia sp. AI_62]